MHTNLLARLALALAFLLPSAAFAGTILQIEQGSGCLSGIAPTAGFGYQPVAELETVQTSELEDIDPGIAHDRTR